MQEIVESDFLYLLTVFPVQLTNREVVVIVVNVDKMNYSGIVSGMDEHRTTGRPKME